MAVMPGSQVHPGSALPSVAAQPAERAGQADAKRIKYLEKLVGAYGPKSLQYDIEHPNDGLNSADPGEVQRTARSLAESGGAGQAGQVAKGDEMLASGLREILASAKGKDNCAYISALASDMLNELTERAPAQQQPEAKGSK